MKTRWRHSLLVFVWISFFTCMAAASYGQPGDPGGTPGDPVPLPGIGILIAIGGALGGYSFFKKSKKA